MGVGCQEEDGYEGSFFWSCARVCALPAFAGRCAGCTGRTKCTDGYTGTIEETNANTADSTAFVTRHRRAAASVRDSELLAACSCRRIPAAAADILGILVASVQSAQHQLWSVD